MTKKKTAVPAEQPVEKITKGYKVTDPDMQCRGFQYELEKVYEHKGSISPCQSGFHFCPKIADCFSYYQFDKRNRVFEVEALGEVIEHEDKIVAGRIRFVREIPWEEMLKLANEGDDNVGLSNTGDRNTGHSNTGHRNTGDRNTGHSNTGHSNTGHSNTGHWNTGDRNTGHWNTGHWNTGHSNTGDRNTGHWNTGHRNTGHSNTGHSNTGAFCTETPPFTLFDKPTTWTLQDFENSDAFRLMSAHVNTKMWVPAHAMTDEEKAANKGWKNADGYYKDIPFKEAFTNAWHNWNEENRAAFTNLPNFDAAKFEQITGVKVD